jgi:tRNA-dihydrouridine synthase
MISAAALFGGGPFEKWYIDGGPRPEKTVFQLVGAESGQIVRAAALLDSRECAGIDLNMGCSAPLIRKTGAGVAWMASVDRAGELVKEVRKAVKHRLSVKIRTGLTDDFEYLVRFCRRLESEGAELVILHPRTAKEKFKRLARWDYVAALRAELRIPVAGNGDIEDAEGLIRRASGPCDAVMAGRAAVRQPWIFAQAKEMMISQNTSHKGTKAQSEEKSTNYTNYTNEDENSLHLIRDNSCSFDDKTQNDAFLEETGLRFLELLARWQPTEFHFSRARRFFGFFCDNLKWGNHLKTLLNRENSLAGIERVWREHFLSREQF